jgi:nicotinamide phosphoribosyltransferase
MSDNGYEAVKTGGKYYAADFTYWPDGSPDAIHFGKELTEAEVKGAVECLWDIFGGTTNDKGYRTLNQRVGLIYGDSITPERCQEIMKGFAAKKFASDNTVLGIGSYTFQYNTRDTLGWAMKATYVEIDHVGMEIFKDPKTDAGTKKSAKGLLRVERTENGFKLFDQQTLEQEEQGELRVVFENGNIINQESIETIRARLAEQA